MAKLLYAIVGTKGTSRYLFDGGASVSALKEATKAEKSNKI